MDNDNLPGSEQLLRDDDGPQRLGGSTTGVANNMSISLFQPKDTRRVQSCIHAGYDGEFSNSVSSCQCMFCRSKYMSTDRYQLMCEHTDQGGEADRP